MSKIFSLTTIWLILFSTQGYAQDSLTITEAVNMHYQAEKIVKKELNELLNAIANSDYEDGDRKTIITNSYTSGNRNNIFLDPTIIVEDDIDPNYKSSSNEHNSPVSKYLIDFELLYKRSNNSSVIFSDIRASNPKKGSGNYIFLKVYYNSFFRNGNNSTEKEYTKNYRVASVRMIRNDNKWVPFIDGIAFFSPEDTLKDLANDIPLYNKNTVLQNGASSIQGNDSANNIKQIEASLKAEETQKFINEEKAENDKFNDLIAKGDKARISNNFPAALQYFNEAKGLRPLDRLPVSKIIEVNNTERARNLSKVELYDQLVKKGDAEEKKRNYREASRLYKNAQKEMPEKSTVLDNKIKEMDNKWEVVSELELKYEAGVNYKDLVDDYDKAIKKNKDNSDLYVGRGKCYEKLNNSSKALKDYDYAYSIDKKNLQALLLRAELKKKRNEKDDNFSAMADYTKYLNSNDQDLPVYELMSDLRLVIKQDNYDGAVKDLDDGLKIDSKYAPFYYKKGLIFAKRNDPKEAVKNFTMALNYDSTLSLAYFHRGKSQLVLNSINNAALDFRSAREKGLDAENIKNIGTYAQGYADRATKKYTENAVDSAIVLVDFAITINPANSEYWFNRGVYFLSKRNNQEAVKCFDQSIQLNSNSAEAYYKLGLAHFNLNDYNAAAKNFKKTTEMDAKHFLAQKGLGDASFALKDYNSAAQSYEACLKIINAGKNISTPETISEVYNSMGKSYLKMNETDQKALEAFDNSIKKNSNYAEAYYDRGLYYHKKKELSDAIKDMEKAVSLDTKHVDWYFELANTYRDKNDFQNAANYFKYTIGLDTLRKYPNAIYLLANCNYESQDYASALANYLKVQSLNLNSTIDNFNYELGNTYLNLNKPDSALEYLHKAFLKDSTNGNVLYSIATSHFLKGNPDEAFTWFEKAFQTGQLKQKMVKNDKLIANLRDDKRLKALMKRYL